MHTGCLVDKEVPRRALIYSGMSMMICGCLAIDPPFIKTSEIWAAIMLSFIDFGSGMTQVPITNLLFLTFWHIQVEELVTKGNV